MERNRVINSQYEAAAAKAIKPDMRIAGNTNSIAPSAAMPTVNESGRKQRLNIFDW